MPEVISMETQGLRELERKLIALGPKVSLKAVRSALVAGGSVIKREAQQRAPVKTGRLRKAMYLKRLKNNPFKEMVIFGVRHGKKMKKSMLDAFYWTFMEFGTKTHTIDTEKRALADGKTVFGKSVQHPGVRPRDFVRSAFETKKNAALDRIKRVLQTKIAQCVKETA